MYTATERQATGGSSVLPGALPDAGVIVVDDDVLMLSALRRLLISARFVPQIFSSGAEFFAEAHPDRASCIILDAMMPDMSGLQVQAGIQRNGAHIPVIFLSGSEEIPIAVAAMREGAVDFIQKPFDNADLILRVRRAIDRRVHPRNDASGLDDVLRRIQTLTSRESSVLEQVVAGMTNKESARNLGGSSRTIEVHRRRIMEKMAAPTLADLVRMRLMIGNQSHTG